MKTEQVITDTFDETLTITKDDTRYVIVEEDFGHKKVIILNPKEAQAIATFIRAAEKPKRKGGE